MHPVIKKLRGGVLAIALFSLFINVLMLTAPIYMLQIYDRVLGSRSEMTLLMLTLVAVGLFGASAVLDTVRARLLVRLGLLFDRHVSVHTFPAQLAEELRGAPSRDRVAERDVETIRGFLSGSALTAFFDAPWMPLFIALVFAMHPLLGSVALAGALALLATALLGSLLSRRANARARSHMTRSDAVMRSALRSVEAVTAMGLRDNLMVGWLNARQAALTEQMAVGDASAVATGLAKSLRQILQVAMLASGAYLVIHDSITPGVMIAASIIMGRALAPVESAIAGWRAWTAARSAYGRLESLLARHPLDLGAMPLPRPSGHLSVEGVVAAAPGEARPILRGVSFEIGPGEVLGVVGRTASGKTALARVLVGVWPPSFGHVRLDGSDVSQWDHTDLGQYIGYVPEECDLLNGTVAENIARFGDPDPERILEAARTVDVHDLIQRLPEGYDTLVGDGGARLSGGQKQRIALARAVYGNPALVVLDEPNSRIDFEGDQSLLRSIANLKKKGTTVVIISHRPTIVAAADKILILNQGRVEMFGPRGEVVNHLTVQQTPSIGNRINVA